VFGSDFSGDHRDAASQVELPDNVEPGGGRITVKIPLVISEKSMNNRFNYQ
jgi:hypothetical protein